MKIPYHSLYFDPQKRKVILERFEEFKGLTKKSLHLWFMMTSISNSIKDVEYIVQTYILFYNDI